MLQHIFAPLFEVSANPASHPKLHLMLQQAVGQLSPFTPTLTLPLTLTPNPNPNP